MAFPSIQLCYPGWEADKTAAEKIHIEYPSRDRFEQKIKAMKHKQQLYDGDRSHPDIQVLDNTSWSYKGWEEDKEEVERRLKGDCSVLELGSSKSLLLKMKKKQMLSSNRDSIECLRELDSTEFTYPDWQIDKSVAEKIFTEYPSTHRFHEKLTAMKNKQQLHEGDRSHPDIVTLDDTSFTYPGWEEDRKEAIRRHCGDCTLFQLGVSCSFLYDKMVKKQQMHEDRTNLPVLEELDNLELSYPAWRKDKEIAEQYYAEFSTTDRLFDKVEAMKNKQRLHMGDRSHQDIVELDSISFTYQGWEADKAEAERRHTGDCTVLQLGSFHFILDQMKKKESLHDNRSRVDDLVYLDTLFPGSVSKSDQAIPSRPSSLSFHATQPFRSCCIKSSKQWDDTTTKTIEANKCVVCLEYEPTYAFIPCGHLCVCSVCEPKFDSSKECRDLKCPICRKSALCVTRIFTT